MNRAISCLPLSLLMAVSAAGHEGHSHLRSHAHAREVTDAARAVREEMAKVPLPLALDHDFDDPHRTAVDYFPNVQKRERGVPLGYLSLPQRRAVHALLTTTLSHEGYLLANDIRALEDVLRQTEVRSGARLAGEYGLWFFGAPSDEAAWGWKLEGHHLSVNVTVADGQVRPLPLFLGASPNEVRVGPKAGLRVLGPHQDRALALRSSLTDAQAAAADDGSTPAAEVIARGVPGDPPAPAGLRAADMTVAQQEMLVELIATYARALRPELAEEELRRLRRRGLDEVRFLWRGGTAPTARQYYRVHGPTLLLEYDLLENARGSGDANHVHILWRDPERDFGADLLREHYEKSHRDGR